MQITIETARIEDYLEIGNLIRNELGYAEKDLTELKETLRGMLADENYAVYVARQEGKTVGFMGLSRGLTFEMQGMAVRVIALAVDSTCQRTGVGAQFLAQAEQYALENNIRYISLTSGLHRPGAHAFYERNGFEKKGFNFKKLV